MKIDKDKKIELKNIFDSKKKFHMKQAKLPVEEKIKILVKLQEIGKQANPEMTKNKRVWKI